MINSPRATLTTDDFVEISREAIQKEQALLQEFAFGEHLSHTEAYKFDVKGNAIAVFQEADGQERIYRVIPIEATKGGIVGRMYIPATGNASSQVFVNFAGTHNGATAHADLESNPGESSFLQDKKIIMHQINWALGEVAKKTGKPVSLTFSGHSLGGALAQQAITEAMRYTAKTIEDPKLKAFVDYEEQQYMAYFEQKYGISKANQGIPAVAYANFKHVGALNINTWNSAGVSKAVERLSNQVSAALVQSKINIKARFGMVEHDAVQQTGAGTALSNAPSADVSVLKMHVGLKSLGTNIGKTMLSTIVSGLATGALFGPVGAVVGGIAGSIVGLQDTVVAHTAKHFVNPEKQNDRFELLSNKTPEGHLKIKNRLQKKSSILQSSVIQTGMNMLHRFGHYMSKNKAENKTCAANRQSSVQINSGLRVRA